MSSNRYILDLILQLIHQSKLLACVNVPGYKPDSDGLGGGSMQMFFHNVMS